LLVLSLGGVLIGVRFFLFFGLVLRFYWSFSPSTDWGTSPLARFFFSQQTIASPLFPFWTIVSFFLPWASVTASV